MKEQSLTNYILGEYPMAFHHIVTYMHLLWTLKIISWDRWNVMVTNLQELQ